MPSDLQIIDSFERLREQFVRENPSFVPLARQRPEETPAETWVVEAWIQAMEGRAAAAGAQQRRVRALARAILGGRLKTEGEEVLDEALTGRALAIPEGLERARSKKLWPLAEAAGERSLAEEARAWGRALPGLTGLRAWRFLERLGRPVVAPETPLRRFLWRLGILEDSASAHNVHQRVHSLLERIAGLTGLSFPLLGALVRWQTTGERELAGGRWCGVRPRCKDCPFRPGCAWARFHSAENPGTAAQSDRRTLEPLRRQLATGHEDQLQEIELLAVALQKGVTGLGVFELAEALLRRFGGLRGLERATVAQLAQTRGISESRAAQLKAALEMGRRVAAYALQPGDPITCSEDIWRAYGSRFRHLPQEHFVIVLLDAKNRVIHDHIVSKGTLTGSLAHPREVFQEAIRHAAAGVILLHNHPSGDPATSREDKAVTTRLTEAGQILGIRVLDHVILGADSYYSFKDEGEL